ncbi:hypothetical protein D3C71_2182620 [compost metagenome]
MPSSGAGTTRMKGLEVIRMNSRKPTPIIPWTEMTRAFSEGGRLRPKIPTAAPNAVSMTTHSIIEPSWFPHTPDTL